MGAGLRDGRPLHLVRRPPERPAPFGTRTPYIAAVVDLAEGPRMMTEIVATEGDDLRVGMPLEVTFRQVEDFSVPVFRSRT